MCKIGPQRNGKILKIFFKKSLNISSLKYSKSESLISKAPNTLVIHLKFEFQRARKNTQSDDAFVLCQTAGEKPINEKGHFTGHMAVQYTICSCGFQSKAAVNGHTSPI
jgi:hypothetical protein